MFHLNLEWCCQVKLESTNLLDHSSWALIVVYIATTVNVLIIPPVVEWFKVQSRVAGNIDDHYNGSSMSLYPHGDTDEWSSLSNVKLIGQKQDCPSMTLSG